MKPIAHFKESFAIELGKHAARVVAAGIFIAVGILLHLLIG